MFSEGRNERGRVAAPTSISIFLMIWRACDLDLAIVSSWVSKCHSTYNQIYLTSSSCLKIQVLKIWWEWPPCLPHSYPLEHRSPGPNILTASVIPLYILALCSALHAKSQYRGSPHFVISQFVISAVSWFRFRPF